LYFIEYIEADTSRHPFVLYFIKYSIEADITEAAPPLSGISAVVGDKRRCRG